jgi:5-methylcytosine-specific restriction endonuclease McrA
MADKEIGHSIISRKEARERGLKRFFTGVPCKHGHLSERYVSTKNCAECAAIHVKNSGTWFRDNQARRSSRAKELKVGREDEIRLQKKAWRDANRDQVRETDRIRGARHKNKVLARAIQWQKNNPDKVRARSGRRRARVAEAGTYTAEDVHALFNMQNGECAYCKADVSGNYHVDHIMPLARGGTNTKDNIQLCCPTCNIRKGWSDPDEFAARFKAEFVNAERIRSGRIG